MVKFIDIQICYLQNKKTIVSAEIFYHPDLIDKFWKILCNP
jgi:hypothetical protein